MIIWWLVGIMGMGPMYYFALFLFLVSIGLLFYPKKSVRYVSGPLLVMAWYIILLNIGAGFILSFNTCIPVLWSDVYYSMNYNLNAALPIPILLTLISLLICRKKKLLSMYKDWFWVITPLIIGLMDVLIANLWISYVLACVFPRLS